MSERRRPVRLPSPPSGSVVARVGDPVATPTARAQGSKHRNLRARSDALSRAGAAGSKAPSSAGAGPDPVAATPAAPRDSTLGRTREALLLSERWHNAIVDSLAEGVVVQDAEGRIVESNPTARAILGLDAATLTGRTSDDPEWQTVWSDGKPARGEDLPSTIARTTGEPVRGVVIGVRHPSGTVRWLRVSASPLRDAASDEVLGAVVSFSDVTEARRGEQALLDSRNISDVRESQESAAKYRGLLEAAPDAMVVVDGAGEIVLLNAQAERQFGYRRDELVGQQVKVIIPEGFAERLIADDLRSTADALLQQIGMGIELFGRREDGTEFPIEIMLSPLESAEGILITAAIRDISARKAAEEALRVALGNFQDLVDADIVGVFFARQDGRVFYANDYFLDLLGYTREELEHGEVDWRAMTPPEWLQLTDRALDELREQGSSKPFEKEYMRRDGSRVPVFLADTRLAGPGANIAAFVLDISERKRGEDELLALNAELEGRVKTRTAALEAANREMEAFSYSVSHDLRAPLRSIDAFSQILLREHAAGLDPEARRVLDIVVHNAQHMGQLIDDLLTLSRIGRKNLDRTPVDMEPLVRSVVEELQATQPGRTVEFDIGPLASAFGDAGLLRQVWVNLFDNAVKFTGPVQLAKVEVRCEPGPRECRFTVRDNGVGFDPRYSDKLFQPFQRLHQTSEFEGTGIGLAIVARIVRRLGGEVWADGAPGEGATFGFSLPAGQEAT